MEPENFQNELPTPVNPVINPATKATPNLNAEIPVMPTTPVMPVQEPAPTPSNLTSDMGAMPSLNATDPITMPDPVKEPDPLEVELNAPFKAAEPVPGSIGSAISMPTEEQQAAMQAQQALQQQTVETTTPTSNVTSGLNKKMNKTTIMLLCALAGMTIIALVAVLIYELNRP